MASHVEVMTRTINQSMFKHVKQHMTLGKKWDVKTYFTQQLL